MSKVHDLLRERRQIANDDIKTLRDEIKEIDEAIILIVGPKRLAPPKKARDQVNASMNRNQVKTSMNNGVLLAIKNGNGKPREIQNYMLKKLELKITAASVSYRLTHLFRAGFISRDKHQRWKMVDKEKPESEPEIAESVNNSESNKGNKTLPELL